MPSESVSAGIFIQKGSRVIQTLQDLKFMATQTAEKEAKTANSMTMEELLAQQKPIAQLQRGDVVEGTVIDMVHGEILVDVGAC